MVRLKINTDLSQEQVIDALLEQSRCQETVVEESDKLQVKYRQYLEDGKESTLNELLELSVKVFWKDAYSRTSSWYMWTYDLKDELKQRIMIWVYEILEKLKKEGKTVDNFGGYTRTKIRWNILDWYRKEKDERKNRDIRPLERDNEDEGVDIIDIFESIMEDPDERELVKIFARLFTEYCLTLMNMDGYPPEQLALCYARILSHLEYSIKDSKETSAKWALEQMKDKTVFFLSDDSERQLRYKVDGSLIWGGAYREKIENKQFIKGEEVILGEVIYTDSFISREVDDWSRNLHKKLLRVIRKDMVKRDKEFASLVREYRENSDILRHFIKEEDRIR